MQKNDEKVVSMQATKVGDCHLRLAAGCPQTCPCPSSALAQSRQGHRAASLPPTPTQQCTTQDPCTSRQCPPLGFWEASFRAQARAV